MTASLDLSIIIVSWNTRDTLAACLASLPAAVGDRRTEIIVADNASSDGTVAMLTTDFPHVRIIETGGNLGFARGNNLAVAASGGERVLLLNPDTVCPPGSLATLCARLDALPDAAAIGPDLVDDQHRPTACWGDFPRVWHHWRGLIDPAGTWLPQPWRDAGLGRTATSARQTGRVREATTGAFVVDYVKGACLLTRRAVWDEVGPLDERFFLYFEETDWCRRATVGGRHVYLCPDVVVQHLEGQATGQVSEFGLRQLQHSYRLYLAKHHGATAVARIRRAQFWQYRWKAFLQRLSGGRRAAEYELVARLQREDEIAPTPPS